MPTDNNTNLFTTENAEILKGFSKIRTKLYWAYYKRAFENGEDFGEWVDTLFGSFITERNQNCSDENIPLYSLTIQDGITPKTERYTRDFLVKDDSNAYKIVFPKEGGYTKDFENKEIVTIYEYAQKMKNQNKPLVILSNKKFATQIKML